MLYEAKVTFHSLQSLVFSRSQDKEKIEKEVAYSYMICPDRDKLIFLTNDNYQICRLYLAPYEVVMDPHTNILTIEVYKSKRGKAETNVDSNIPIATIQASKVCLMSIQSLSPARRYKSCLSFAPNSIQHISILSGESTTQRFRGFINLIVIMFLILNLRNMIDNFLLYGARFSQRPFEFIQIQSLVGLLIFLVFIEFGYYAERLRFQGALTNTTILTLLTFNICALFLYLPLYCHKHLSTSPVSALGFTSLGLVLSLKLISYMQVNSELKNIFIKAEKLSSDEFNRFVFANHEISEQNLKILADNRNYSNLSLLTRKRLYYFLIAPTLCYQLDYPRSPPIRWSWLIKRIVEFSVISAFQLVLWLQYIEPELARWFSMMEAGRYTSLQVINRLMRLSIPNTLAWITGFYNFFHVFLNIISEIIRFGDRDFYMDWWNCRSLEEYWKTWNLPVHFWFIRHCYNPLLSSGLTRVSAGIIVFLLSALAHEYLICVPLGIISFYAFIAMLLQAPAIYVEKKLSKIFRLENSELGNVSFWLFFCILGQPICLFIYYSLYMEKLTKGPTFSLIDSL